MVSANSECADHSGRTGYDVGAASRNCCNPALLYVPQLRRERQHYQSIWQEGQEGKEANVFVKVGQYPPLSVEPSPEFVKAHGPDDAALYKKG